MLVLYIILGIIMFITLMLALPVTIIINKEKDNNFYIKYLFFKFKLNGEKKEQPKDTKQQSKNEEKVTLKNSNENNISKFKNILKKFTIKEFINLIKHLINDIKPNLKFLLSKIKIYNLDFYIGICGEDSFEAAKKTGLVSSFSYGIFYKICSNIKSLNSYSLKVEPLFLEEKDKINLNSKISFRPLFVVVPCLKIIIRLLKFRKMVLY